MFTTAPRDVAIAALVVSNTSGNNAAADQALADVLTNYTLLQTQAKLMIGEQVWTDKIVPLL